MAGGRPTKMTEETLRKLEDAYLCDATHLQAALFAGISEFTLHDYRKKHPEFSKRIDDLRGMVNLKAKANIKKAIDGNDLQTSKWQLERRDPEYKPKKEVQSDVNIGAQKSLIDAILATKNGINE
jgi:hypothetical protein